MNRLQKKCLIAAAGTHLLLVVALLCSAFTWSKPKQDNSQVLDVIPANLVDALVNQGTKNATPPPPAPPTPPAPEPQPQTPTPPAPQPPVVKPPPEPVQQPEPMTPPDKDSPEPAPKPKPHKIEVNLKPVVKKVTPTKDTSEEDAKAEREARAAAERAREARARAFRTAARAIKENTSSSMTIDMPADLQGDSTVSYANYGTVVISIYTEAWRLPDTAASDDTDVKVSVTIARDGRVISAQIIEPSGDAAVDRSVRNTLERVKIIAPFPEGSTDKERTYKINFNLKAKRQMAG